MAHAAEFNARPREIRSLTGLRGVAACLVMLYHYLQGATHLGVAGRFLLHGYLAVDLFFVLSGFMLALTYERRFAGGFRFERYASFLYLRLARVYPLYFVITGAVIAFDYAGIDAYPRPSAATILANMALVQAWGFAPSIGGPTWSISTEFAAYLWFPWLLLVVVSGRRAWLTASCVAAVAVLCFVATRTNVELHQPIRNGALDVAGDGTVYPLLRCLAGFVLGLATYRISRTAAARSLAGRPGLLSGLVVALGLLAALPRTDVVLVLLFVPAIACLALAESFWSRLLGAPLVYWLGEISYSIYLNHALVDRLARERLQGFLVDLHVPHAFSMKAPLEALLVIACSALTYYAIEKPARNALRRLSERPAPSAIGSEPAAP